MGMPHGMAVMMALRAAVPQAVYDLDGQEHTQQLPDRPAPDGGTPQSGGSVTLKALWKKDGKQLELHIIRKMSMRG